MLPDGGSGPGVIVVQEWWGLDSGIKEMADRLGEAGFVALAPDLYHGELAAHDEMDKAGQLMQDLPIDRAARDMTGAVDFLADHDATTGDGIGVMGFCMGGMLTFVLAAERPDKVKAAVPFYGFPPIEDGPADLSKIEASIQGHMAENDDFFPPEQARALRGSTSRGWARTWTSPSTRARPRLHGPPQRARHPRPRARRRDLAQGHAVPPRQARLSEPFGFAEHRTQVRDRTCRHLLCDRILR